MKYKLIHGDSEKVLSKMDDNSVDSIITDPPYGLSFMGKKWDYDVPSVELWRQVFRVLKHGGHLLSFAGSRTYHRMAVNIEDAGFEIRDQIMWIYGSGFPKSMNIAKAIDKKNGYEGKTIGTRKIDIGMQSGSMHSGRSTEIVEEDVKELSPEAKKWDGWGTALKPAHEPIVVARKPLDGTVVDNVLKHGTGGLNIEDSRVGDEDTRSPTSMTALGQNSGWNAHENKMVMAGSKNGRFPSNIIHDGSDEVVSEFPVTKSGKPGIKQGGNNGPAYGKESRPAGTQMGGFGDEGSAARFFKEINFTKQEHESIVLARKPLDGTVVDNVLEHGTGGLNIDGCRIGAGEEIIQGGGNGKANHGGRFGAETHGERPIVQPHNNGRFPANLIHDGSDEVVSLFPDSKSNTRSPTGKEILDPNKGWNNNSMIDKTQRGFKDEGSAARFFYCAKASKQERNKGFDIELNSNERPQGEAFGNGNSVTEHENQKDGNYHPTVKPVDLMKYLCRLVTPPNGIVLDPFMGSGTTGIAATVEGFNFIGVEMSEEYLKIADTRISHWVDEKEELIIEERKQRSIFDEW